MIWSVSWKNVWRNKVRSIVVIMAVSLGLIGGIFACAVMLGVVDQRIKSAIDKEISNIQIHNTLFLDNSEPQYVISGVSELESKLNSISEITYSERMKLTAMASSASTGTGIVVYGIDPEKEKKVTTLYENVCDSCGSYFGDDRKNQIYIGNKLAEKLKIKLRSKIVLTFQDINGNLASGAFKVTGIYKTENTMFDESIVFVKIDDLRALTGFGDSDFHEIAIKTSTNETDDKIAADISQASNENKVETWKEIMPEMGMLNDFMDLMLYILIGIILLAMGFGIVNTMLMVVLERTRELGMLMAVGMNKMRVFAMIMLETIFLSLTGGIIGMIISTLLIVYYNGKGIDLSQFAEGFGSIGYSTMIYPVIGIKYYIGITLMVIFTGILASIYPARKALKLKPAEAVRSE